MSTKPIVKVQVTPQHVNNGTVDEQGRRIGNLVDQWIRHLWNGRKKIYKSITGIEWNVEFQRSVVTTDN